jgi:hypothetical protein
MAREATSPEELEKLGAQLGAVAKSIIDLASQLRSQSIPAVRLHLGTLTNSILPDLEHWLDVAEFNSKEDVRAYLRGAESPSAMQRRYDEKRKL